MYVSILNTPYVWNYIELLKQDSVKYEKKLFIGYAFRFVVTLSRWSFFLQLYILEYHNKEKIICFKRLTFKLIRMKSSGSNDLPCHNVTVLLMTAAVICNFFFFYESIVQLRTFRSKPFSSQLALYGIISFINKMC